MEIVTGRPAAVMPAGTTRSGYPAILEMLNADATGLRGPGLAGGAIGVAAAGLLRYTIASSRYFFITASTAAFTIAKPSFFAARYTGSSRSSATEALYRKAYAF